MAGSLTAQQIDSFARDGFLFPIRVADEPTVTDWRSDIESLERRWHDDASLPRPFTDYARANFHLVSSTAARLAHDPAILDAVESIIGPDILCWMSELIVKEPHSSKVLTMHQDLTYWGLDGADHLVSAWVALSDATADNGAMRFVPGSHLAGQIAHSDTFGADNLLSRGQEVAVDVDPDDEVFVELQAGEMSLHHGHMFHGSGPKPYRRSAHRNGVQILVPERSTDRRRGGLRNDGSRREHVASRARHGGSLRRLHRGVARHARTSDHRAGTSADCRHR